MKRSGLVVIFSLAAAVANSAPRDRPGAIPELDYTSTCKATPPVAMDRAAQLKSCLNDEKQAKADLPKQWVRSKPEWRSSCLRQTTLGGLSSYVELITCLEMHDPNPPSLQRPGLKTPSSAPATGAVTPDVGSPIQRGTMPR